MRHKSPRELWIRGKSFSDRTCLRSPLPAGPTFLIRKGLGSSMILRRLNPRCLPLTKHRAPSAPIPQEWRRGDYGGPGRLPATRCRSAMSCARTARVKPDWSPSVAGREWRAILLRSTSFSWRGRDSDFPTNTRPCRLRGRPSGGLGGCGRGGCGG